MNLISFFSSSFIRSKNSIMTNDERASLPGDNTDRYPNTQGYVDLIWYSCVDVEHSSAMPHSYLVPRALVQSAEFGPLRLNKLVNYS